MDIPRLIAASAAMTFAGCSQSPGAASVNCRAVGRQGMVVLGWVDPAQSGDLVAVKAACLQLDPGGPVAKVILWDDEAVIPSGLPMTDEQVEAEVANYVRNENSGAHWVTVKGKRHEF